MDKYDAGNGTSLLSLLVPTPDPMVNFDFIVVLGLLLLLRD